MMSDRAQLKHIMPGMTIGGLAASSRTRVTTIRFYERTGLMSAADRTVGGHRHYTTDDLRRLLFIRRAREMEFSIEEIRSLLVLIDPTRTSCRDVHQMAAAHLSKLRQKIAQLTKLERVLARAVEQCSGEPIAACPVLDLLQSAD